MPANRPLLECIPNFSEGQNEAVIDEIKEVIESVKDQSLLHIDRALPRTAQFLHLPANRKLLRKQHFRQLKLLPQKLTCASSMAHIPGWAVQMCAPWCLWRIFQWMKQWLVQKG
jgi:hypothetical protein